MHESLTASIHTDGRSSERERERTTQRRGEMADHHRHIPQHRLEAMQGRGHDSVDQQNEANNRCMDSIAITCGR